MSMQEITLPEVRAHTQTARFFRSGNKDMVEISFVGSKDNLNKVVTPAHMAQFRTEWDAYCDGRPPEKRAGTPLTDLPSISQERADDYIHRNVHNLEELTVLNDGQCQALGHGTLTDRRAARDLITTRSLQLRDKLQKEVQDKSATIGPVPAEKYAGNSDLDAVKADVAELKTGIAQILAAMQAKKPGRPKKAKAAD